MTQIGKTSVPNINPLQTENKVNINKKPEKPAEKNKLPVDQVKVQKNNGIIPASQVSLGLDSYSADLIKLYDKSSLPDRTKLTMTTLIAQQGAVVSKINQSVDQVNDILAKRMTRTSNKEDVIRNEREKLGLWVDTQSEDYTKFVQLEKAQNQSGEKRESVEDRIISNIQINTSQVTEIYNQTSASIVELVKSFAQMDSQMKAEKLYLLTNMIQANSIKLNGLLNQVNETKGLLGH